MGYKVKADVCFYSMLELDYVFPESPLGRKFCRDLPAGSVNRRIVETKAQKEGLIIREHETSTKH